MPRFGMDVEFRIIVVAPGPGGRGTGIPGRPDIVTLGEYQGMTATCQIVIRASSGGQWFQRCWQFETPNVQLAFLALHRDKGQREGRA